MKRTAACWSVLLLLLFSFTLSSCYKEDADYYNATPTGYQNVFNDEFKYDDLNWSVEDPAHDASVSVSNDILKIAFLSTNSGSTYQSVVQTGANLNRNFLIQTRIKSDNAMGLLFGATSNNYGYSFFIDDQGYFAIYNEGDAGTSATKIMDWQYTSAIRSGWNDLELEQYNGYWTGYINGTKVFEIQSQPVSGSRVGFIVEANTVGNADYLTVKW